MSPLHVIRALKDIRTRLGITTREVAELSQKIAHAEGNPEFHISNAWLTQIENSGAVPSLHKLYTLSIIYRLSITELFAMFGVDLTKTFRHQSAIALPRTHLAKFEVPDPGQRLTFPVRFHPGFDPRHTNLLSRMVEVWGDIPVNFLHQFDVRHTVYGYVGASDYTLYPIVRPGSFVQIDPNSTKIKRRSWQSEYERPIYFVELRDGYRCCWCELEGDLLWLIPHPLSPARVRTVVPGVEAEIVGQVTAAALRLTDLSEKPVETPVKTTSKG